jgi:hypothetical protein
MKVLRKTVKKAVNARKQVSSVAKSLGQVANGLKMSSDSQNTKLSIKFEIPDSPKPLITTPKFSQDPKQMMDFGMSTSTP